MTDWEGRSPEAWARTLGLPLLELNRTLSSTNDRLREMADGGAPYFAAVVADAQLRGRGRGGKRWRSEGGTGLWLSILVPPPPGGPPGVTTLAVGVAAAEAVEEVSGIPCRLKWPNDLFLGETPDAPGSGKLGGILCERGRGAPGIVAGIGINLRPGTVPLAGAVNLETWSGVRVSAPRMAEFLVARLRYWADPPPDRVGPELRAAWEARDLLMGREVEVQGVGRGTADGLAADGALQLRHPTGRRIQVRAGGVRPIGERPSGVGDEGA